VARELAESVQHGVAPGGSALHPRKRATPSRGNFHSRERSFLEGSLRELLLTLPLANLRRSAPYRVCLQHFRRSGAPALEPARLLRARRPGPGRAARRAGPAGPRRDNRRRDGIVRRWSSRPHGSPWECRPPRAVRVSRAGRCGSQTAPTRRRPVTRLRAKFRRRSVPPGPRATSASRPQTGSLEPARGLAGGPAPCARPRGGMAAPQGTVFPRAWKRLSEVAAVPTPHLVRKPLRQFASRRIERLDLQRA
jgi:hypothetical protein